MAEQTAGFQFAKPFDVTNPVSTDKRYGKYTGSITVPFASVAEAIDLIKPALRYQGLQCVIANETGVDLWWFRSGIADGDLVKLQTDVDVSGKADKSYVDDLIRNEATTRESLITKLSDTLITGDKNTLATAENYTNIRTSAATELTNGVAKITTTAIIQDENTVEDTTIVTPKKWWQAVNRFINLQNVLIPGTWSFVNALRMGTLGYFATFTKSLTSNALLLKNNVYQAGAIGKAKKFNGTNQSCTIPNLHSQSWSNITFTIWFKTNVNSPIAQTLFTLNNTFCCISILNGKLFYTANAGGQTSYPGVIVPSFASVNVANGEWHHIAVSISLGAGTGMIWLDGVRASSNTGWSLSTFTSNINAQRIASNIGGNGNWFNGLLDQCLIYNTYGSDSSIAAIYSGGNGTATPNTIGLIRRYEFDETSTTSGIDDISGVSLSYVNNPIIDNNGKVPTGGTASEAIVFQSTDGITNGERGQQTFGDFAGGNIQQGKAFRLLINNYYPFWADNFGHIYINPTFNGQIEGNGSVATAYLHLGSGKSSAGDSALKFTPGTLLNSIENGAWEFDGNNLFFSISGARIRINADLQSLTDQGNTTTNDIEVITAGKGIILRDADNNSRYRITIKNGDLNITDL